MSSITSRVSILFGPTPPPRPMSWVTKVVIGIAIVISALSVSAFTLCGIMNAFGDISFILLVVGCVLFGAIILGAIAFGIYSRLIKKPTIVPKVERREIPPKLELEKDVAIFEDIAPTLVDAQLIADTNIEEYSPKYANRILQSRGATTLAKNWSPLTNPANNDISLLATLAEEQYQAIQECLQMDEGGEFEYPKDPEQLKRFYLLAAEHMKMSVAIGSLTLTELCITVMQSPTVVVDAHEVPEGVLGSSYMPLVINWLNDKRLYYREALQMTYKSYALVRFLHKRCKDQLSKREIEVREGRFYEFGTIENSFRELFNQYCLVISSYAFGPLPKSLSEFVGLDADSRYRDNYSN
ncbi:hypothetical protein [Chlamydia vaughanii]|uniref:hypothetical protein n=1 Tax=Chlamydia vaughanii TaxID=3112552 RepID=UPI0032B24198